MEYDPALLKILPEEIIQRDYGCGDPSRYVSPGDVVLDLGSGGGKICYIASQLVGSQGAVHGVDMNDEMLGLARKYQAEIGDKLGYQNVHFHKGKIQDLALDLEAFESHLQTNPVNNWSDWDTANTYAGQLRQSTPMIASDSIDIILSNCVLNLVRPEDRKQLFSEMYRVLRRGGRAVISDIVCDEPVPVEMMNDPTLWSGCISGAFVEDRFFEAFAEAGFYGMEVVDRFDEPWAVINGIEFRSTTVRAYKGKDGPCMDHHEAVIYKGPWKSVTDDDGHVLHRGRPMAVCRKTFEIYGRAPYRDQIVPVPPREPVADEDATEFDCHRAIVRTPQETKGSNYSETSLPENGCGCGPDGC